MGQIGHFEKNLCDIAHNMCSQFGHIGHLKISDHTKITNINKILNFEMLITNVVQCTYDY